MSMYICYMLRYMYIYRTLWDGKVIKHKQLTLY